MVVVGRGEKDWGVGRGGDGWGVEVLRRPRRRKRLLVMSRLLGQTLLALTLSPTLTLLRLALAVVLALTLMRTLTLTLTLALAVILAPTLMLRFELKLQALTPTRKGARRRWRR